MDDILVLTTGGTIDKTYFDALSEYQVGESAAARILATARVNRTFRLQSLMRKDSLEITADDRRAIVEAVTEAPERRIVVTHGTDTMTETAQALSGIPAKTIVLCGAFTPARFADSDATFNLGMAVAAAQIAPAGVWIAMNGTIFEAGRVRKVHSLGTFVAV